MTHYRSTAHLFELQGYGRPKVTCRRVGRRWIPLYQFSDGRMARAVMGKLLIDDNIPDLLTYELEDFRILPPDPRATFDAHRKAIAKARRADRPAPRASIPASASQRGLLGPSGAVLRNASGMATKVGGVHHREGVVFGLNLRHARRVGR